MKPRYTITLALTEQEKDRMEALRESGITQIDIFREGLDKLEKEAK